MYIYISHRCEQPQSSDRLRERLPESTDEYGYDTVII